MSRVSFQGTSVSNLAPLSNLAELTTLRIGNTASEAQIDDLQKSRPRIRIDRRPAGEAARVFVVVR